MTKNEMTVKRTPLEILQKNLDDRLVWDVEDRRILTWYWTCVKHLAFLLWEDPNEYWVHSDDN